MFQFNYRHGLSTALIAVIIACALWLGHLAGWGARAPSLRVQPATQEVALDEIRLQPDNSLRGVVLGETTARPLFNPSRRPLPAGAATGSTSSSALQKGRYILTGVSISPNQRVALLLEVATNKTVRVEQSKRTGDVLIESVTPSKVILKRGTEREEIPLKIAPATMAAAPAPQKPAQVSFRGQAASPSALPAIAPLVRTPPAATPAPGAPQAATDLANADPITEADVAEREARVQARRNRQSASGESAPR